MTADPAAKAATRASRSVPFLDLKATIASQRADLDRAIAAVLDHAGFINGPEVGRFEQAWAEYCGARKAVGCSNGTAALHALYACLGIGPGDEIIVPSHTFIATPEAVRLVGAKPVFADVDEETWLLDPASVRAALTPRTKAIVAVNLYGAVCDIPALQTVADEAGAVLLEDAAQSHGATLHGRRSGTLAQAASFSFFPGKNLGAFGDAGALTTNDEALAHRLHLYVNHGRESKYVHEMDGQNARLDTLQAAILLAKLPMLDAWTARRRALAARYREHLAREPFTSFPILPQRLLPGVESSYHLFVVRVPYGLRETLRTALTQRGIATGLHYPVPCHLQPVYTDLGLQPGQLPITERLADEVLSLPIGPEMTEDDVDYVMSVLADEVERLATLRRRRSDARR